MQTLYSQIKYDYICIHTYKKTNININKFKSIHCLNYIVVISPCPIQEAISKYSQKLQHLSII